MWRPKRMDEQYMTLFSDTNREVTYHILELLPTIDQALHHMQLQLEELRMEESAELLKITAEAIGSISYSLLPLLTEDNNQQLLQSITNIRESIIRIVDAYKQNNILAIQTILANQLLPAYNRWQQELEQRIRPLVLS